MWRLVITHKILTPTHPNNAITEFADDTTVTVWLISGPDTGRRCKGCHLGAPSTTSSSIAPKLKSWWWTSDRAKKTCSHALLMGKGETWTGSQSSGSWALTSRRTYPGHPTPLHGWKRHNRGFISCGYSRHNSFSFKLFFLLPLLFRVSSEP